MAESLEALKDKWYHILEERQSKLLDAEHDNQEDENHSSLYLGYYQEIMDEIMEASFFQSSDTELTDQAIDKKIKQRLDELHKVESEDHEQYTSSLQKSYGSYNSESEGELDGSGVYKGPVEYTDDEVHRNETVSPQKQSTTLQHHSDEERAGTKSTISLIQQQKNTTNTTLNVKYIGSGTTKMALESNSNSNQLEEQQQQEQLQKTQENQEQNEGDINDKLNYAKQKSEIMEKKDERTRETRLLERINKAVDDRITHGPKGKGKPKGGCGGSNSEEGWFSWLNCGVDDRDGDSD
eukprot:g7115.t1